MFQFLLCIILHQPLHPCQSKVYPLESKFAVSFRFYVYCFESFICFEEYVSPSTKCNSKIRTQYHYLFRNFPPLANCMTSFIILWSLNRHAERLTSPIPWKSKIFLWISMTMSRNWDVWNNKKLQILFSTNLLVFFIKKIIQF